jgi:phosphoribosylaminoimidazole-succinocarboxamide synthase
MLSSEKILQAIPNALDQFEVPGGLTRGKVRDFYILADGKRRSLITTDRLVVFDQLIGLLPYKGQVLNELSAWWFEHTRDIIPNHLISVPDPNVSIVRETTPIQLEIVVRGYITGTTPTSLWPRYVSGEREIYGIRFPDNLTKNQALPAPIVTASTKSTVGRDNRIPLNDVVEKKYLSAEDWERIQSIVLALFKRGQERATEGGLILVDTKYEFGFDQETHELLLIDEIHTPDSSRYWNAQSFAERVQFNAEPENFDRELVRLWYVQQGYDTSHKPQPINDDLIVTVSQRYQQVYEMITDNTFAPAAYPAQSRIEASIIEFA